MPLYETDRTGYIKIDNGIAGRIDMIMQLIPDIVNHADYNGDVYKVIYNKGLGVLQKSSQYPNQFLGNIVSPDANNKIRGVARLQELSRLPQIARGIFSAMSMITGQYFMTQINKNLSQIEKNIDSIRKFLENDKRSKLQSEEEFLKITQKSLDSIQVNKFHKQSNNFIQWSN